MRAEVEANSDGEDDATEDLSQVASASDPSVRTHQVRPH